MAETKLYPYVILRPAENAVDFRFLGQFDGRSPEQAVEAALLAGAIPSDTVPPLAGGVIAVPASKWYAVDFKGTQRVDYEFTRAGEPEEDGEEPAAAEPADPPADPGGPPDTSPVGPDGLKRL